ncbi:MAG: CPBP family glutamic-type intramembrane protease [bacterium]|nr:CPBP family glutamic-type intramembrane protease [bacterium]
MNKKPFWGFGELFDFTHEHSFKGRLGNIGRVFLFNLVWLMIVRAFLKFLSSFDKVGANELFAKPFGALTYLYEHGNSALAHLYQYLIPIAQQAPANAAPNPYIVFFFACVMVPLWETVVFQVLPIMLALWIVSNQRATLPPDSKILRSNFLFWACCFASIIFGLGHGGVVNILIQGVGGMTFCWLYLKNSNSHWSSYWSVVAAHAFWNFMVIFGIPFIFS